MTVHALLQFMHQVEALKSETRHCFTKAGIAETVAAHSWRLSLFALLLEDEMEDVSFDRVLRMCIVHDLGEAMTGDIPSFQKTGTDEREEETAIRSLLSILPEKPRERISDLFMELIEGNTKEARLFRALDKLEAVMQHNESDIDTWLPLEYTLNQTYGEAEAKEFPFLAALRAHMKRETQEKIANGTVPCCQPESKGPTGLETMERI